MLWHISKQFFFLSPCQKHAGFFLWYFLWKPSKGPGGKTQKSLEASLLLGPSGVFHSGTWYTSLQQVTNYRWGSPPWPWFPRRFLWVDFCSGALRFSPLSLSLQFGSSSWPGNFKSLRNLRRSCGFFSSHCFVLF